MIMELDKLDKTDIFNVYDEWEAGNDICLDILNEIVSTYYFSNNDEDMFNEMMNLVYSREIYLVRTKTIEDKNIQKETDVYFINMDRTDNDFLKNKTAIVF